MNFDPYLTPYAKINSKRIVGHRLTTLKLLYMYTGCEQISKWMVGAMFLTVGRGTSWIKNEPHGTGLASKISV